MNLYTFLFVIPFTYANIGSTISPETCPNQCDVLQEISTLRQMINQETMIRIAMEQQLNDLKQYVASNKLKQMENAESVRKLNQTFSIQMDEMKQEMNKNNSLFRKDLINEIDVKYKDSGSDLFLYQEEIEAKFENITNISAKQKDTFQRKINNLGEYIEAIQKWFYDYRSAAETVIAFSATEAKLSTVYDHITFQKTLFASDSAYDNATGLFYPPSRGTYLFQWTIVTKYRKSCPSKIVVNKEIRSSNFVSATYADDNMSGSQSVILSLEPADIVGIIPHVTCNDIQAEYSTFTGYKIG